MSEILNIFLQGVFLLICVTVISWFCFGRNNIENNQIKIKEDKKLKNRYLSKVMWGDEDTIKTSERAAYSKSSTLYRNFSKFFNN